MREIVRIVEIKISVPVADKQKATEIVQLVKAVVQTRPGAKVRGVYSDREKIQDS